MPQEEEPRNVIYVTCATRNIRSSTLCCAGHLPPNFISLALPPNEQSELCDSKPPVPIVRTLHRNFLRFDLFASLDLDCSTMVLCSGLFDFPFRRHHSVFGIARKSESVAPL